MFSYARQSVPTNHDYFTNQPWLLEPGYFNGTKPETRKFLQRSIDASSRHWGKGDKFMPA